MKRLIRHPYVLFQHFKNTSLLTNVYLNGFCPITASSRLTEPPGKAGTAAQKQDVRTTQVAHFTGFHTNIWVSKHFLCTEMMCRHTSKGAPSSPVFIPNIQHPLSSLAPSSLIYILTHRKRDLLWWQHSHFFTLCTISPCLKFTDAQQVVRYLTKHFIYYTTEFL